MQRAHPHCACLRSVGTELGWPSEHNAAVTTKLWWQAHSSRDKGVMHLLRCLVFVEANFGCHLRSEYIDNRQNHLANDLSRNNLSSFLSKVPEASRTPHPTSGPLLDLLMNP